VGGGGGSMLKFIFCCEKNGENLENQRDDYCLSENSCILSPKVPISIEKTSKIITWALVMESVLDYQPTENLSTFVLIQNRLSFMYRELHLNFFKL
jgi:hypothetical protein